MEPLPTQNILKSTHSISKEKKSRSTEMLVITGVIVMTLGIIASLVFAQTIEHFFWQIRTTSVVQEVDETGVRLLKDVNLADWQNDDVHKKIEAFTTALKRELPNILAVKVYTPSGLVVWSDMKSTTPGTQQSIFEGELLITNTLGRTVDNATVASKQELGRPNVLEIYTKIKTAQGDPIGFIEFYFEDSDIAGFVNKIYYTILGSIVVMLGIGVYLMRFVLRRQDDIILRQAHELADIVEQSPFGIYTINTKGNIISINSRMLEIINETDPSKIIGKVCWDLRGVQNVCKEVPVEKAILGESFDIETKIVNKDGNETHYRYRGVPLFDENNKAVEEVLFTVEDITQRKKFEADLESHARALEEGVSERTKELQNKIEELEQFQRLTIGRELRMTELKEEIERLRAKLKQLGIKDESTLAS
jgi:PAS domain S-box-containing protein